MCDKQCKLIINYKCLSYILGKVYATRPTKNFEYDFNASRLRKLRWETPLLSKARHTLNLAKKPHLGSFKEYSLLRIFIKKFQPVRVKAKVRINRTAFTLTLNYDDIIKNLYVK